MLQHPISTFLTHEFSILNRKVSNQNATHFVAFLPWFEEMNLGLAWNACKQVSMVLKTHMFSACVNGKSQRLVHKHIPRDKKEPFCFTNIYSEIMLTVHFMLQLLRCVPYFGKSCHKKTFKHFQHKRTSPFGQNMLVILTPGIEKLLKHSLIGYWLIILMLLL